MLQKLLACCLVGFLMVFPDWQKHHHGQIRHWKYTIHQTSRGWAFAQGLWQCVRWIWMRRWVQDAPVAQLQIENRLRQIRWYVFIFRVFSSCFWFCKHYRWHVLRVYFHWETLLSRGWLLARSWLPVFCRRPLGEPTWFHFSPTHPLILRHFQMPHRFKY